MTEKILLYLIAAPLIGAMLSYVCSLGPEESKRKRLSGILSTLAAIVSGICALALYQRLGTEPIVVTLWDWFSIYHDTVRFEFLFDRLSAVMCLIITGVGSIIHLYSVGYMAGDESEGRYFAYLNLFLFSMLILVLASSLPVMFIGWEGVGLCSYLLIGFWFDKEEFTLAGQKAFIVNRIGDMGFFIAMFLIAKYQLGLTFMDFEVGVGRAPTNLANIIALMLFLAAAGKSAQMPLFVWLPDAMAGPTPVSALIHAATMVTAGVYLCARVHFLFDYAPAAQDMILIISTATAFIAATAALVQRDIKKVLAYSTVSQLGFMFMAVGAGSYAVAMFHVVTHAFFKALLFLSAGAVIYGCHHEQLFDKFGGLWKKMPATFGMYLIGTLAISGIPFFSGAVSKDLILESMHHAGSVVPFFGVRIGQVCWIVAVFTAGLTAFYMFRSLFLTFFGSYRGEGEPHDPPATMLIPLLLLAVPSAVFGKLYGPLLLSYLDEWGGRIPRMDAMLKEEFEFSALLSVATGIIIAVVMYLFFRKLLLRGRPGSAQDSNISERGFFERAWGFDDVYRDLITNPLSAFSSFLSNSIDRGVIDATVSGTGIAVEATGDLVSKTHTGRLSQFVPSMVLSLVCFIAFIFLLR